MSSSKRYNYNIVLSTSGSLISTNTTNTNVSIGTLNVTGLTSGNINFTGALYQNGTPYINSQWTTGTGGNLTYTGGNVGIGNITPSNTLDVSGTGRITTSLTTGAVYSTNITSTNIVGTTATVATLLNTNAVSTNFSAGTVSATTITGGSISLSGNLSVAGTLTVVNITATNLMDTNLTAGIARITTNLAAIGNSNTVGAIITTGGNVGIGTTAPSGMLHLNGAALFTSTGNLTCTGDVISFGSLSDARLKKNIESISTDQAIDIISKLRSVTFDWRDDIFNENKRNTSDIGFIAQEVESIVPLAVDEYTEVNTGEVFKRIKHERLIPYLLSAIQYLLKKESL